MKAQDIVNHALDDAIGNVTLNYLFRLSRNAVKRLGHDADGYAVPDVSSDRKDVKQRAMDAKLCNTPLSSCKAKNPMFCPYHGLEAMSKTVGEMLSESGLSGVMGVDFKLGKVGNGWWKLSLSCPAEQQDKYHKIAEKFLDTPGFIKGETSVDNAGGQFVKHDESAFFKVDEKDKAGAKMSAQLENIEASIMDEYLDGKVPGDAMKQILDMMAGMQAVEDDFEKGLIPEEKYVAAMPELISMMKQMCDKILAKKKYGDYTAKQKENLVSALSVATHSYVNSMWSLKHETSSYKKDLGWNKSPNGFPGCGVLYESEQSLKAEVSKWIKLEEQFDKAGDDAKAELLLQMDELNKSIHDKYLVYEQCQHATQQNLQTCLGKIPFGDKEKWKTLGLSWPKHLSVQTVKAAGQNGTPKKSVADIDQENLFGVNAQKFTDDESGTMEALEHDESSFPSSISMADITAGKKMAGASGNPVYKVTIGGKKYAAKVAGSGKEKFLENEMRYDAAYRAAGILVPDFKSYDVGGKVVKLSKWIDGTPLSGIHGNQRKAAKENLLKGFALDALFSNWDVLGTGLSNIVVDKDGNCWRIDNGGAGRYDAHGHAKELKANYMSEFHQGGTMANPKIVAYEEWDSWADRKWIDDFRTMRRASINEGMFDYTTAEIFNAAGHIDFGRAVATLPTEAQKALAKPLFEMKQMTMHCVGATMSGIKNMDMLTIALDAMYDASQNRMRELSMHNISWADAGFGETDTSETVYQKQPFGEPKPVEPQNPSEDKANKELKNSEYTGETIAKALVDAAKSINYHAGFVAKDANGKILGNGKTMPNPDFTPPPSHFTIINKINREKLAKLAESDAQAKHCLEVYDTIISSRDSGFKNPIGQVNVQAITSSLHPEFKTQAELAFEKDKAGAIAKYTADMEKYKTALMAWKAKEAAWNKKEEEKAIASGENPYKNFYDFVDKQMKQAYDTNGIAHGNGEGIGIIEYGKHANKFGATYSASTSEDSWTPPSSRLKVLELVFRGMTPSEIQTIPDHDPLVNNGAYSSKKARSWFKAEAEKYQHDEAALRRDSRTYAIWKGLQTLKLENETGIVSTPTGLFDLYRHDTHSLALARGEYGYSGTPNTVNSIKAKAANASSSFMKNEWGSTHFLYDVPLWNVGYSYNDANVPGSTYPAHKKSEHEITSTLIGLLPYCCSGSFVESFQKALSTPAFQSVTQKRKARLAPFVCSLKQFADKLPK